MNNYKTAVIVGRFQADEYHQGYEHTFKYVKEHFTNLVIVLGETVVRMGDDNPLPFELRKNLLQNYLYHNVPDLKVTILKANNHISNEVWSKNLDFLLDTLGLNKTNFQFIVGRDSFQPYYSGKFKDNFFEVNFDSESESSTNRRKEVFEKMDFSSMSYYEAKVTAKALIWATQFVYPKVFSTVDVVILSQNKRFILLGKKPGETKWRLPGGFVDPTDVKKENAAYREAFEETLLPSNKLNPLEYVDSLLVDDYRYRKTRDKIMTTLYMTSLKNGDDYKLAKAGDDLEEVKWFPLGDLKREELMEGHIPLVEAVFRKLAIEFRNEINH